MRELHILALGAGVQSTTLYLMALEGQFHLDAAVFADTQEEPQAVYTHLGWLMSRGHHKVPIVTRTAGRLGDDVMHGRPGRTAAPAIPHYTKERSWQGVATGKARRACTRDYKIRVIERAIRQDVMGLKAGQRMPRDVQVYQYIGISVDEARRAVTIRKRFAQGERRGKPRFPLLERDMTRADCQAYNGSRVPHEVPRSACVFCPLKTEAEWARTKATDPAGWARSVELDTALRAGAVATRNLREAAYLHESCVPLDQVELLQNADKPRLVQREFPGFSRECEGACGV